MRIVHQVPEDGSRSTGVRCRPCQRRQERGCARGSTRSAPPARAPCRRWARASVRIRGSRARSWRSRSGCRAAAPRRRRVARRDATRAWDGRPARGRRRRRQPHAGRHDRCDRPHARDVRRVGAARHGRRPSLPPPRRRRRRRRGEHRLLHAARRAPRRAATAASTRSSRREGTFAKLVGQPRAETTLRNVVPERVAAGATSGRGDASGTSSRGATRVRRRSGAIPSAGWGVRKAVPVISAAAHARGGRPGVGLAAAAPREGRRRGLRVGRPRGPRADPRGRTPAGGRRRGPLRTSTRDGGDFVVDFARRYDLRRSAGSSTSADAERRWAAEHPLLHEYDEPGA